MLNLARRAVRWLLPARWWLFAVGSPAVLAGAAVLAMAIGPGAPELGASAGWACLGGGCCSCGWCSWLSTAWVRRPAGVGTPSGCVVVVTEPWPQASC